MKLILLILLIACTTSIISEAAGVTNTKKLETMASAESAAKEKEAARVMQCLALTAEDAICSEVTSGYKNCIVGEATKRGIDCHDILEIVENNLRILKARLKQAQEEEAKEAQQSK